MKKPAVLSLLSLLAIIVFNWVGWPFKVRFNYAPLNYWAVVVLCVALPVAIVAAGWSLKELSLRVVSVIVAVLVALPATFLGVVASIEAIDIYKKGIDPSFTFLREIKVGAFSYRLYQTDCGATCSVGLALRKEYISHLGIKLVTPIWSEYRAYEGDMSLVNGNEIQITSEGAPIATIHP